MNAIFHIVYSALMFISEVTGLTYNEVNIIAYYMILPFIYVALADKIWRKHLLKIAYIGAMTITLFLIPDFSAFSDWLFLESVRFLLSFQMFGWDYTVSSVLICVIFPGIVLMAMIHLAYPQLLRILRFGFSDRIEFDPNPPKN